MLAEPDFLAIVERVQLSMMGDGRAGRQVRLEDAALLIAHARDLERLVRTQRAALDLTRTVLAGLLEGAPNDPTIVDGRPVAETWFRRRDQLRHDLAVLDLQDPGPR